VSDVFYYNLELSEELRVFEPEVTYALEYVERHYPIRRMLGAERTLSYGGRASDIPATFFERAIIAKDDGVHLAPAHSAALFSIWPKRRSNPTSPVDYDAVGLLFFMLSRIEERGTKGRDRHDRFSSAQAAAVEQGLAKRAIADEAAEDIAQLISGTKLSSLTKFEIVPTHDVDRLKSWRYLAEPLRYFAGDLLKRRQGLCSFKRLKVYTSGEPAKSFRRVMTMSEEFGLKSRFFFMGPSDDPMDSPYATKMVGTLRRQAEEVAERGHIVGFHPGYRTFRDPALWQWQKQRLEEIIGQKVHEGRQHVLRYDVVKTPRIWAQNQMRIDYTLAYPDMSGFRNGSCRPHRVYDLEHRRPHDLDQCATPVMDFAMFDDKYRQMTPEEAFADISEIVETTRQFGGRLTYLFHTGHPSEAVFGFFHDFLRRYAV